MSFRIYQVSECILLQLFPVPLLLERFFTLKLLLLRYEVLSIFPEKINRHFFKLNIASLQLPISTRSSLYLSSPPSSTSRRTTAGIRFATSMSGWRRTCRWILLLNSETGTYRHPGIEKPRIYCIARLLSRKSSVFFLQKIAQVLRFPLYLFSRASSEDAESEY